MLSASEIKDRARASVSWWFCVFAEVLDDTRRLISGEDLRPNIYQLRLEQAVEWARREKIPVRIVGLKPRQVGGTTYAAAILYHFSQRMPLNVVLIADILARS